MIRSARVLAHSAKRALVGLRRNPATAAVVIATIAVAFFLVGLVHTMGRTVDAATASWQRAHMVLYLEQGVLAEPANALRAALAELPAVERAEYVSAEQTTERLQQSLGVHDELMRGIEPGMLPASIEVTLRTGVRDVAMLEPMIERLRAMDGVEDVEFADAWVDDMSAMRDALHDARSIALVLVLLLGLYLASTALVTRLGPRVHEATVARLVGASTWFVRLPLLIEGAIQGALGAALAALGLWLCLNHAMAGVSAAFGDAAGDTLAMPAPDQIAQLVVFIAAGATLGMAGTWLATRRHASP